MKKLSDLISQLSDFSQNFSQEELKSYCSKAQSIVNYIESNRIADALTYDERDLFVYVQDFLDTENFSPSAIFSLGNSIEQKSQHIASQDISFNKYRDSIVALSLYALKNGQQTNLVLGEKTTPASQISTISGTPLYLSRVPINKSPESENAFSVSDGNIEVVLYSSPYSAPKNIVAYAGSDQFSMTQQGGEINVSCDLSNLESTLQHFTSIIPLIDMLNNPEHQISGFSWSYDDPVQPHTDVDASTSPKYDDPVRPHTDVDASTSPKYDDPVRPHTDVNASTSPKYDDPVKHDTDVKIPDDFRTPEEIKGSQKSTPVITVAPLFDETRKAIFEVLNTIQDGSPLSPVIGNFHTVDGVAWEIEIDSCEDQRSITLHKGAPNQPSVTIRGSTAQDPYPLITYKDPKTNTSVTISSSNKVMPYPYIRQIIPIRRLSDYSPILGFHDEILSLEAKPPIYEPPRKISHGQASPESLILGTGEVCSTDVSDASRAVLSDTKDMAENQVTET